MSQGEATVDIEASEMMRLSAEVSHPPTLMEVTDDLLRGDSSGAAPHAQGRT
ncbi:MAG: hypothetical protein M3362_01645 [Acidobacteriota bacterium]|nr:hypothetical protein [Acidobacteriota bacterium]